MAWDPPWDTAIHGSHAPGVGAGEPRASAATRRVEGAPAAAAAHGDGPDVLGHAVEALEEPAEFAADGAARDRGRLAPAGVQALLGVEKSTPTQSARDQDGAPRSDSVDQPRQSSLGCAEDSRGAAEAGPDGLAGDGVEVHARAAAAAVAGVAHVFGTRTHLSLAKDAPEPRSVQPPSQGSVVEVPRVGGLHHEYLRRAA